MDNIVVPCFFDSHCTFSWVLAPLAEFLPGAKFTLRPSLAFSYIDSVTVRHSNSGV